MPAPSAYLPAMVGCRSLRVAAARGLAQTPAASVKAKTTPAAPMLRCTTPSSAIATVRFSAKISIRIGSPGSTQGMRCLIWAGQIESEVT
jgi:hypothetical protein